jgi:hypothetical protein
LPRQADRFFQTLPAGFIRTRHRIIAGRDSHYPPVRGPSASLRELLGSRWAGKLFRESAAWRGRLPSTVNVTCARPEKPSARTCRRDVDDAVADKNAASRRAPLKQNRAEIIIGTGCVPSAPDRIAKSLPLRFVPERKQKNSANVGCMT